MTLRMFQYIECIQHYWEHETVIVGPTVHTLALSNNCRGAKKGNFLISMSRHSNPSNTSTIKVSKSRVLKFWSAELLNSRAGLTRVLCFARIVSGLKNLRLRQMPLETMVLQLSRCLAYLVSVPHLERLHRLAFQDAQKPRLEIEGS